MAIGQQPSAINDTPPCLAVVPLALLAAFTLALHLAANAVTPYEFHRDEFLYLAMGRHLDLWRMDFPPFIALMAEATRGLLGDSLAAIRLGPALAGTALVVLSALVAREMGGSRTAQVLAALAVVCNGLFLRSAGLFMPVVFDQLWWVLALFALARLARTGDRRWWLFLGVAGGLGLLTKWSILFIGFGVLVGLLATPLRRAFLTPWPYLALGLALLIGHPSLAGQAALDWPLREQMDGLREEQLGRIGLGEYVGMQLLFSPPGLLLAAAGLGGLLVAARMRAFRAVGVACATVWVLLLVLHGKSYYVGPVFPALFAAGAVLVERIPRAGVRRSLVGTVAAALVAYLAVGLPLGLPVVAPAPMAAYAARLGMTAATTTNRGTVLPLPQDYADMLGWQAKVEAVARAWNGLAPDERRDAVIFTGNYGRAGALQFYGPSFGLPDAVCPCGTFWQYGPGAKPGRVVVALGISEAFFPQHFDSVATTEVVREPWGVEEEQEVAVRVARGPRRTLQEEWRGFGANYR